MKKLLLCTITCILLLGISLSACARSTFPTGKFSMNLDNDLAFEFLDDGTFNYYIEGNVYYSGTYSIQGNELTWETDSGCDSINNSKATYIWTYKDNSLKFTSKGEDPCQERWRVLNNIYYDKVQ